MKKRFPLILSGLLLMITISAQQNANNIPLDLKQEIQRQNIRIPNIEGYQTLKGDFHIHTVFSDGLVWPTVRVKECWAEGLDVMAITDHIEYRPHRKQMKDDHNLSYDLAVNEARKHNILLIKASEITRSMPPGHLNAFFISDANQLDQKKYEKAFDAVKDQNGLMIWNHPGWKAQQKDTCLIYDIHKQLLKEGRLHGMEVMNYNEWYPIVLQWCIDNQLAVFANSDIHNVNGYVYDLKQGHRPMTLLFAKERTQQGVREAIESARTVAWFDQQLAGPGDLLKQLFEASVELSPAFHQTKDWNYLELTNNSDLTFSFINKTPENGASGQFTLKPGKSIILSVKKDTKSFKVKLDNCHTGLFKNLELDLLK